MTPVHFETGGKLTGQKMNSTPVETSEKNLFTLPQGWQLSHHSTFQILESPDGERVRLAIVESVHAEGGLDLDAAVKEAWKVLEPHFERPIKIRQNAPARDGWRQIESYGYELSPGERLMVSALAFKQAKETNRWSLVLFHGSEAGFERRKADVRLIAGGFRPVDYQRESFAGREPHALTTERLDELTKFLKVSSELCRIPGVALTLVNRDQVLFAKGFGVRKLGDVEPVDTKTLFMIASNTKQFTTLLLAKLVDAGRFSWETPVTSVFPKFRLGAEAPTRSMKMKHLVSASTGLPRKDIEWLLNFADSTPERIFSLLSEMVPTSEFGEVFQYSNVLGAAAGYIAGFACEPDVPLGMSYDRAMQTLVFDPLEMTASTFEMSKALERNHAVGHADNIDGQVATSPMDINRAAAAVRPSVGLWTNIEDLSHYVQMELRNGMLASGTPYMSESSLLERRRPGVVFEEDAAYGMGLVVKNRYGVSIVDHGGALIGFKSNIFWFPEIGLGGAILTNADNGNILVQTFIRKLLEVLFDGQPEADEDVASYARSRNEQVQKHREGLSIPPEFLLCESLGARYENQILGEIRITRTEQEMIFDFGEWKSQMATRRNEDGTFSFFTIDPGVSTFEFVLQQKTLVIRDKQHEYVFTEKERRSWES